MIFYKIKCVQLIYLQMCCIHVYYESDIFQSNAFLAKKFVELKKMSKLITQTGIVLKIVNITVNGSK